MAIAADRVTVVTATAFEARAARAQLGGRARVIEAGIALRRLNADLGSIAISCGLAGGLRNDLPTGTVLVPRSVRRPDGSILACDPDLVENLLQAARELGAPAIDAPLVTAARIIRGADRARWANEGYAGADMETGALYAARVACVRVILDTPARELSPAWEHPARVFLRPDAWFDLPFLAREAPRCAALAARVIAKALPF
ncbi:MAG TPA: hypothetical protein VFO29_02580 [Candidatus Rubrimentiphilum sp.]|nr:hypothetical protein [Candidatus Rubrimentiphilum sp.]